MALYLQPVYNSQHNLDCALQCCQKVFQNILDLIGQHFYAALFYVGNNQPTGI